MGNLEGKTALITGAASGIGRATAILFAQEGASIAIADCNVDGGVETLQQIKNSGGNAVFIQTDIRQSSEAIKMIDITLHTFGRLDILHNNAGVNTICLLGEQFEA